MLALLAVEREQRALHQGTQACEYAIRLTCPTTYAQTRRLLPIRRRPLTEPRCGQQRRGKASLKSRRLHYRTKYPLTSYCLEFRSTSSISEPSVSRSWPHPIRCRTRRLPVASAVPSSALAGSSQSDNKCASC